LPVAFIEPSIAVGWTISTSIPALGSAVGSGFVETDTSVDPGLEHPTKPIEINSNRNENG
jgi:hypothetical protein